MTPLDDVGNNHAGFVDRLDSKVDEFDTRGETPESYEEISR
ncbi:MAG: hypothetical protein OEU36_26180 [Gammaproteobacteria bacterium]|nr:hypothetical protein [Gammaproteobacteria bacterium]